MAPILNMPIARAADGAITANIIHVRVHGCLDCAYLLPSET